MERKIESKYSLLEYTTILSIIENICIGLESFKNYSYLDNKTITAAEKHIEVIKKYYYELKRKVNTKHQYVHLDKEDIAKIELIFDIEYSYKPIVVGIWKKELTDIESFDEEKPYKLLVHMFRNDDTIEYKKGVLENDKIGCISTSFINNDAHKHFQNDNTNYGLVYDININNFLGACEIDAQLEQTTDDSSYINKHSFCTVKKGSKHSINSIIYTYDKNYQMTLTKTPYCLKNPYYTDRELPFYNEIGLDKAFSKPKAVIHYYGHPEIDQEIKEKVEYFANLYNIPIIRIKYKNKTMI
ncbi:MAG TPA: hypothetical protein GXZ95_04885 [Mollicutes bacterium]|nr:hypothetical protein [Mollicutes bacterium]